MINQDLVSRAVEGTEGGEVSEGRFQMNQVQPEHAKVSSYNVADL